MATLDSVKTKIQKLIDAVNAITGNHHTDLTEAVSVLLAGYGQGSGGATRQITFMAADNETQNSVVTLVPRFSFDLSAAPKLTRESTVDKVFSHVGWSRTPDGEAEPGIFANVTEDLVLYPVWAESVRYYTVRFWDGSKLLRTEQVPYGGSSNWTYKKTGAYFQGWTPEPVGITGDLDCYGDWVWASFATDTWEQITQNCRAGKATEYYKAGDEREMYVPYGGTYDGATGDTITLKIARIGNALDASGQSMHGMVVVAITPYRSSKMAYRAVNDDSDTYASLSYPDSDIYSWLLKVRESLPSELRLRYVKKSVVMKYAHLTNITTFDLSFDLWPLSISEVSGSGLTGGYEVFGDTVTTDALESRIMCLPNGEAVPWVLRDPASFDKVYVVKEDGSIVQKAVTDADGYYVVFAFFL